MKNKKLKGKGFNAIARKGTCSSSEPSPLNVAYQKSQKSQAKKNRKREAFIAKELKKEESKQIMIKLASNKFNLKLLDSSATVGKKKTKNELLVKNEMLKKYSIDDDHDIDFGQAESDYDYFSDEDGDNNKGNDQVDYMEKSEEVFEMDAYGHTVQSDNKRKITVEKEKTKRKRNKSKKSINTIKGSGPITNNIPIITATVSKSETVEPEVASVEKAYFVTVERTPEIEAQRMNLPVFQQEQEIMETILANSTTIICGETGSGKTTQLPQFLYEAGFGSPDSKYPGMIGITQPRRVAAISMAKRVQEEMGLNNGEVSYQIRYDKDKMGKNTRIKFMTDGILLRELSNLLDSKAKGDLLLSQYSCIIIDEAHERTVGTDILIGWLTRIVKLRNSGKIKGIGPLKLVIMSATLRVEDFVENETLFPACDGKPPVVKVEGRQHQVIVHYNKKTPELDYIEEVLKKIIKIHTKLPHGGILVFVTGQQEVSILVKKLQKIYPESKNTINEIEENEGGLFDNDFEEHFEDNSDDYDDVNLSSSDDEEDITQTLSGTIEEEEEVEEDIKEDVTKRMRTQVHVLPLFSMLSTQDQMKVFQPPPENHRMIIIATNVAETSLTIPGIRYVIDAGKVKSRSYDTQTGLENFSIGWTSKASADQRAGRAGRTGKGHCYRLYSSAVYEQYFEKFTKPEILRVPIEGVVLNMKSMGILKIVGFPFPTIPDQFGLKDAENLLINLNAIGKDGKITNHGMMMSKFPVVPRLSRVIVEGLNTSVMAYVLMMVAGLSVGDIFYRDLDLLIDKKLVKDENGDIVENEESEEDREERKEKRGLFYKKMQLFQGVNPTSDHITILRAIGSYLNESERSPDTIEQFCKSHFLRSKALEEAKKLYKQLLNILKSTGNSCEPITQPPTSSQEQLLKQILMTGYIDCVAKLDENTQSGHGKHAVPSYETEWSNNNENFVIHPSSSIYRHRPAPKYIIYETVQSRQELMSISNEKLDLREIKGVERKFMKGITIISESWINTFNHGSILTQPEPFYCSKDDIVKGYIHPTFGKKLWELPVCTKEMTKDGIPWFAKSLLEGNVFSADVFTLLAPYLETKPGVVTKSWAKTQPKVIMLLNSLTKAEVWNRKSLVKKWEVDEKFLLEEIKSWTPKVFHDSLVSSWPPLKDGKVCAKLIRGIQAVIEKFDQSLYC